MAEYAVSSVFRLIDQFSGPASGIDGAVNKMHKSTSSLTGVVGRLAGGFSAVYMAKQVFDKQIQADASMRSMSAVTGVTGEAFKEFAYQIERTAKELKVFKGDLAAVYEIVGSKMPELLEDPKALDDVTRSIIQLRRITTGATDEGMANSLTTIMNQFNAASDEAASFSDVLAHMQQRGSGNIDYMSTAILKAGASFKSTDHSFFESAIPMQMLAKAGESAEVASTQLASMITKLRDAPAEFNIANNKLHEIAIKLAEAGAGYDEIKKLTGGEVLATRGLMNLVNQIDVVKNLGHELDAVGAASKQVDERQKGLGERLTNVSASFFNATTSADTNSAGLLFLGWTLELVANNMDTIIDLVVAALVVWAGYKIAIWAAGVAMWFYTKQAKAATFQMAIAATGSTAATVATTALAAATTKLGIATNFAAAPIWLIVAAVAAAIATVIFAVKNLMFAWELITRVFRVFKDEGFVAGIKALGVAVLEFILQPLRLVAQAIDGIGGWFGADTGLTFAFDRGVESIGGTTAAERGAAAAEAAEAESNAGLNERTETSRQFSKEVKENNLTIDFANMPDWVQAQINNKSMIQPQSTMRGK